MGALTRQTAGRKITNQSRRKDQAVISSFPSMQRAHFPSAISQQATLLLTGGQVRNANICLLCYLMAVGVCVCVHWWFHHFVSSVLSLGVCLSLCVSHISKCCVCKSVYFFVVLNPLTPRVVLMCKLLFVKIYIMIVHFEVTSKWSQPIDV